MGSVGILALERGDQVHELMRAVASVVGILRGTVDQLLQHKMPRGMAIERRKFEHVPECEQVAVEIADDHDVGRPLEGHDAARAAGRRAQ